MTREEWGYLYGAAFAFALAFWHLATYINPGRNRLTRYLDAYLRRRWVRGVEINPRVQLLLLGTLALVIGIAGVVLFFTGTPSGFQRP